MGVGESKYEVMCDFVSEDLYQDCYLNWINEKWDDLKFYDKNTRIIDMLRFKRGSKHIYDKYFSKHSSSHFPAGIKAKNFFYILTILTYLYFQGSVIYTENKLFQVSYKNLFMMMILCEEYELPEDIIDTIFKLVEVNKKFVDISYYQILQRQLSGM